MFFLGGPNDREALTYAWRMAGDPNVKLKVVRFIGGEQCNRKQEQQSVSGSIDGETCSVAGESACRREKKMDDEFLYDFKLKTTNN